MGVNGFGSIIATAAGLTDTGDASIALPVAFISVAAMWGASGMSLNSPSFISDKVPLFQEYNDWYGEMTCEIVRSIKYNSHPFIILMNRDLKQGALVIVCTSTVVILCYLEELGEGFFLPSIKQSPRSERLGVGLVMKLQLRIIRPVTY